MRFKKKKKKKTEKKRQLSMGTIIFSRPDIDQTPFDQLLAKTWAITPFGTRPWSEIEVALCVTREVIHSTKHGFSYHYVIEYTGFGRCRLNCFAFDSSCHNLSFALFVVYIEA